jgi:hypothetical protein
MILSSKPFLTKPALEGFHVGMGDGMSPQMLAPAKLSAADRTHKRLCCFCLVLAHDDGAAFIALSGWLSTSEQVSAGVCQIPCPQLAAPVGSGRGGSRNRPRNFELRRVGRVGTNGPNAPQGKSYKVDEAISVEMGETLPLTALRVMFRQYPSHILSTTYMYTRHPIS